MFFSFSSSQALMLVAEAAGHTAGEGHRGGSV
jgi:hypothetical protein